MLQSLITSDGFLNTTMISLLPLLSTLVSINVAVGRISTGQHYILKLLGTGETDLYVHYNKAEGITADMDGKYRSVYGNAIMVYSQASRGARNSILAGLTAAGHTYTIYQSELGRL